MSSGVLGDEAGEALQLLGGLQGFEVALPVRVGEASRMILRSSDLLGGACCGCCFRCAAAAPLRVPARAFVVGGAVGVARSLALGVGSDVVGLVVDAGEARELAAPLDAPLSHGFKVVLVFGGIGEQLGDLLGALEEHEIVGLEGVAVAAAVPVQVAARQIVMRLGSAVPGRLQVASPARSTGGRRRASWNRSARQAGTGSRGTGSDDAVAQEFLAHGEGGGELGPHDGAQLLEDGLDLGVLPGR